MCPPFGIGIAIILPLFLDVKALYRTKLAMTPDTGLTSACMHLKYSFMRSMHISSILSMYLQPAYTLLPLHPSAYLCEKSQLHASSTAGLVTFSEAINGMALLISSWCSIRMERISAIFLLITNQILSALKHYISKFSLKLKFFQFGFQILGYFVRESSVD